MYTYIRFVVCALLGVHLFLYIYISVQSSHYLNIGLT